MLNVQVECLYGHMHHAFILGVLYLAIPLPPLNAPGSNGMLVESTLNAFQHVLEALVLLVEDDDADLRVSPGGIGEELFDGR